MLCDHDSSTQYGNDLSNCCPERSWVQRKIYKKAYEHKNSHKERLYTYSLKIDGSNRTTSQLVLQQSKYFKHHRYTQITAFANDEESRLKTISLDNTPAQNKPNKLISSTAKSNAIHDSIKDSPKENESCKAPPMETPNRKQKYQENEVELFFMLKILQQNKFKLILMTNVHVLSFLFDYIFML